MTGEGRFQAAVIWFACVVGGAIVGYIAWFAMVRFQSWTAIVLSGVLGALFGLGAGYIAVSKMTKGGPLGSALYIIGLGIGSTTYFVLYHASHPTATDGIPWPVPPPFLPR